MGKLSISFEASTEEKNEMIAIMNFVMAINGVQPITQNYEAPKAAPVMVATTNAPDFSFTVGSKEELSPDEKALQDFNNEEPVELTKEQEEQAKRDARNAARRERDKQKRLEVAKQAEADKEAETKNSEALEHSLSEKEAEDTPEVSETVFDDETNEEPETDRAKLLDDETNEEPETDRAKLLDEMQLKLGKLDKVGITNECRNLMISKAHAGHKDIIKNKMKADGIAGLPSMSLEQLKEYCLWLVTLS